MLGKFDCFGVTDRGQRREANEDQFLIANLTKLVQVEQTSLGREEQDRLFGRSEAKLLVVADGMGGHASGERASSVAIDTVAGYVMDCTRWFAREGDRPGQLLEDLKSALAHCQTKLYTEAASTPSCRGMGTTVTVAYVIWPKLYVVHAGDSRCYMMRRSKLRQLTRDHTVAQQFVDDGRLSRAEADRSPLNHALWNVVGGPSDCLDPEACRIDLRLGDSLVLCTDGLNRHVSDERLAELLSEGADAETTCRRLVEEANRDGGLDNITVVVARLGKVEEADAQRAQDDSVLDWPTETNQADVDTMPLDVARQMGHQRPK